MGLVKGLSTKPLFGSQLLGGYDSSITIRNSYFIFEVAYVNNGLCTLNPETATECHGTCNMHQNSLKL